MCKNGIAKWVVIVTVVFCGCIIWKTLPEHKRHLEEFSKAGARLAGQVCGVRDRDCFSCWAILKENRADSVPCRTINVQFFLPIFFP